MIDSRTRAGTDTRQGGPAAALRNDDGVGRRVRAVAVADGTENSRQAAGSGSAAGLVYLLIS